jgi:hypothetical protein
VDFSTLPPPNTTNGYRFTITIEVDGQPPDDLRCALGQIAGPTEGADLLQNCLEDTPWVLKRDGVRVTLCSFGTARVRKVTVTGNGPKPAVSWTLDVPPKK